MLYSLPLLVSVFLGQAPEVQSICRQAVPDSVDGKFTRTADRAQAVILVHGFTIFFQEASVAKPAFHTWQALDAPLVKELSKNADVYLFSYGQNAALDTIVKNSKLADSVASLRKLGYSEVILVGHSAGGLIVRHFVEDYPDAGVTRVVQVCAPNAGSPYATLKTPKSQQAFVDCLTEAARQQCLKDRAKKRIPPKVEFLCVVARGDGTTGTDGVVPCVNQWTDDLRKQGVPAVGLMGGHREVVRGAKTAATLSRLILGPQPRWTAARIDQAAKEIFAKPDK